MISLFAYLVGFAPAAIEPMLTINARSVFIVLGIIVFILVILWFLGIIGRRTRR